MEAKKILLAEDDLVLSGVLEKELTKAGLEVSTALNGKQALEMIERYTYDLVLLDILMPFIDGWELLKMLQPKGIKTVIVSNLSQDEEIKKAKSFGAIEYIVKSNNSLKNIVDKILEVLGQVPDNKDKEEHQEKIAA